MVEEINMLTDRQNEYYQKISFLLELSSSATYEERDALTWAKKEIESKKF